MTQTKVADKQICDALETPEAQVVSDNSQKLEDLMAIARKGFQELMKAVAALQEIRDQKLYLCLKDAEGRQRYRTFDDFLKGEFDYTRSYFCQLQKARQTKQLLEDKFGQTHMEVIDALPQNTALFYELSKVPDERQEELMEALKDNTSCGRPITRRCIAQFRKSGSVQSATAAPSGLVEETEPATPVENTLEENGITEVPDLHNTEPKDKITAEEHTVMDKEDMPEPPDSDIENADDVPIEGDDDEADEKEALHAKGEKVYSTIYRLLDWDELHMYLANDESALWMLKERFQEAMDNASRYVTNPDD